MTDGGRETSRLGNCKIGERQRRQRRRQRQRQATFLNSKKIRNNQGLMPGNSKIVPPEMPQNAYLKK